MDRSKKKPPHSFESLSFPVEPSEPAQVDQLPEVRRIWDAEEQAWYYSVVDFIKILTNAPSAVTYWTTFKKRHQDDPFLQDVFGQLKMEPMRARDGKLRETECATRPVMLRMVQSIPSKQAETVRLWLAQIGEEKLQEAEQQTQVDQLRSYYISRGRTPEWADARIRNLIGRNLLTDEWLLRGAQQHLHFGLLTKTIHEGTFGIAPYTHHHVIKQLPKGVKHPRDHYTDIELNVLALSEAAARTLHQHNDSHDVPQLLKDAQAAGEFGGQVREQFEQLTSERVVSSQNFLDQPRGKQQQLPQARQDSCLSNQGRRTRLRESNRQPGGIEQRLPSWHRFHLSVKTHWFQYNPAVSVSLTNLYGLNPMDRPIFISSLVHEDIKEKTKGHFMDDQAVRYRRLVGKSATPKGPLSPTGAATSDR